MSANGRTITKLTTAVSYDGECGKGGGPAFAVAAANVPIGASYSFSVKAPGKAPDVHSLHMIVTGTFFGSIVQGTIAERSGHCAAPKQVENPYLATFSAKAG